MDVRDINNTFVAEDCARTNGTDTSNIDGNTVTGVQIHAPLIDAGTAANTYYGNGELVVTDVSGRVLTTTIVAAEGKAIPEIAIHQRSLDGTNHFTSPVIKGASITSYNLTPYKAPVEQVAVVHTIDATLNDFEYMLKIRRIGTDNNMIKQTTVKTAYFKSASPSTAAQIAQGLADYINNNFNTDPLVPISAAVANTDELVITALPYPFEVGKFRYEKLNFVVELVNFDATVEYNDKANLTVTDTYTQATPGAGTYEQVVQMERFGKLYTGANKDLQSPLHKRHIVALETGLTETYDTVVINWVNLEGDFSANVRQEGSVTLFLPVTNNATNQVGVATIGIMAVLDAYIVTEYGVGIAQIGNIT